jgi:stearoyl-CoA desaturase (delta-9 desaturase)
MTTQTDLPQPTTAKPMSTGKKLTNLAGVLIPFLGLLASPILVKKRMADGRDFTLLGVSYLLSGFGVTAGYHRLLTHRSFETSKPVEYSFAVLGATALEGPPIGWVADHRKHHAFADEEGDPHSPWVGRGSGWRERLKGFSHAHMGWLFSSQGSIEERYAADLTKDAGMQLIGRMYPVIAIVSLGTPTVVGWRMHGGIRGAARGLVWGGLVRAFFLLHATFSINSACHIFGRRRFNIKNKASNVIWLALPTLGEAWHHNHHAFPRSAVHGLGGLSQGEIDLTAGLISALERLGVVWNVIRISPEQQRAKELS